LVVRRQIQEILSQLKNLPNIPVQETLEASIIRIANADSFSIEVTVPLNVLEWFAAIYESEKEIWRDWADYVPLSKKPHSELKEWMQTDIINFVQAASKSQLRKVASKNLFGTNEKIEWLIEGSWKPVTMSGF
jgi:hypothetical protein